MPLLGSRGAASARGFGSLTNFGYFIRNSVRLRSSASAYFNRTPASAGNRKTWTWSGWVKRGLFATAYGNYQQLFGAYSGTTGDGIFFTNANDQIALVLTGLGTNCFNTSELFRDASAWYHLCIVLDTTSATSTISGGSTDRARLYINGRQVSSFAIVTVPAQNFTCAYINNTFTHEIGRNIASQNYFDGYLTEVNFIDGQALTPSSFGSYNASTGVWQPIKYAGTYGTNGFYLNFSDNSAATAAAIGKDYSGNGNNWTPNNISVTAGVTYDSMIDTPTPYADGGNGRGNYAVLNPLVKFAPNNSAYSSGNLTVTQTGGASGSHACAFSSVVMTSGKWYAEFIDNDATYPSNRFGIANPFNNGNYTNANPYISWASDGYVVLKNNKENNSTLTFTGVSWSAGAIIGVAVDIDNNKLWFSVNGTWIQSGDPATGANPAYTIVSNTAYVFAASPYDNNSVTSNFGQRPFTYTSPTGFVTLNTRNLPDSTIKNGATVMAATTYTATPGTGATISNAVNGVSFRPDLLWVKNRNNVEQHYWQDSVRGFSSSNNVTKMLSSNSTAAEYSLTDITCTTTSSGFTVVDSTPGSGEFWFTNRTYVAWQWKAGDTAVTNTSGSITSQVSANQTAGFSVVTYTGTGANATVGHGLGVAPKMVIVKNRTGAARQWCVYHAGIANSQNGGVYLNLTNAWNSDSTLFNNTAPTSSVFSVGTYLAANTETLVAYCFSEVAGYSKFGSYTGNGSTDGPFVYLGFRPRWVMIKRTDSTENWRIWDTSRDAQTQPAGVELYANLVNNEGLTTNFDYLSNGFKLRAGVAGINASGGTYIFAAFAEVPFRYALGR
jgi:hypothetical protein